MSKGIINLLEFIQIQNNTPTRVLFRLASAIAWCSRSCNRIRSGKSVRVSRCARWDISIPMALTTDTSWKTMTARSRSLVGHGLEQSNHQQQIRCRLGEAIWSESDGPV